MASLSKITTYAAWIAVAALAAAARPGAAADLDGAAQFENGMQIADVLGQHREPFNEAWSFADDEEIQADPENDAPTFPNGTDIEDLDQIAPDGNRGDITASFDEAAMLVGTWAWEGVIEGMPAYIETAFYADGTYESYAQTPVIELAEVGYWALNNGMLLTEVFDYAPRMINTPYGPQPLEIEPEYQTYVTFIDQDTVETEMGLSYRID